MGCNVDGCSSIVSPTGCSKISALEHIPRSFCSHFGAHRVVSLAFFPPPTLPSGVLPFLKYIFLEAPTAWLLGSAVPSGWLVGDRWNQLCLPWGLLLRETSPADPTANAWTPGPGTALLNRENLN